jgi:hypothetical protein
LVFGISFFVPIADGRTGASPGAGALFGLVTVGQDVFYVDDAANRLNLFH